VDVSEPTLSEGKRAILGNDSLEVDRLAIVYPSRFALKAFKEVKSNRASLIEPGR